MLVRLVVLAVVVAIAGCRGCLPDIFAGTKHEGEECSFLSLFSECQDGLECCLTAASVPKNATHYCAKAANCVFAQAGETCHYHEDCADHLYCNSDGCGCWPCACGEYPNPQHCCPGACGDAGTCEADQTDDPGCFGDEGNPCFFWQDCHLFLTCCHTTSDWDAGRLCVASEDSCVQVGLGERCTLDTDCVRPLWCGRDSGVCAKCPTCSAQTPRDAGGDTLLDSGGDAPPDAALDATSDDGTADAGED